MSSKRSALSRFCFRVIGFLALQAVIVAVVVTHGAPDDPNHYMLGLADKLQRLERCDGDRLLVMGGSNVAFGIHSEVLQESTGLQTVNLGMQMYLGLGFQLECVRRHARPGDVVVLIPEYHLLASSAIDGDSATILQMLEQYPDATGYFDPHRYGSLKAFMDHDAFHQAHQWFKRAYYVLSGRLKRDPIYRRDSFNDFGDMVAHHGHVVPELAQMEPLPRVSASRLGESIERLNTLAFELQRRGVSVYLSYAPIPEQRFATSAEVIGTIDAELRERLLFPVLQQPGELVFSEGDFFDTAYHLNREAGERRTRAMAAALAAHTRLARRESTPPGGRLARSIR